jgi:DNA polymerase-4
VRKIIHVDMDAFYASVEQRDDAQLRGKPVIVAWQGKRSVVCAASYEARAFGVHSAMPTVRAERLCPSAIFVAPDFTRYRAVSNSVREIFKRHTDLIEPLSLDEAYLDVTENRTGLPTATLVARTIREQIRQELNLTASAGVAPNKFLAKLASDWRKPDALFVIQPEEVDAFLLPLAVGRLPGVGGVTEEKVAKLGIKNVSELRSLDLPMLEHKFGRYGVRLHELARGVDESEVVPDRPTQSISVGYVRARCAAIRNRTHDPAFGREALVGLAERITDCTHGRSQTEDEPVQDSYPQPYAGFPSIIL